ncbi:uncharacterized protein LOC135924215 [Gordionus sp. m RMFG-2023]|uniref:uncharacterized protein LOC135924215 n=1 Tax=Gordionus sp. m RMFG-2023 TaxID=3053472 RepID=UPI0031FBF729
MTVVPNGGPALISRQFKVFCAETGTKHILAPLYHPSSNKQEEKVVAVIKNWLRKSKDGSGKMWISVAYYNNKRKGEEPSPREKFLGRRTRIWLGSLTGKSGRKTVRDRE